MEAEGKEWTEEVIFRFERGWQEGSMEGADRTHRVWDLPAGIYVPLSNLSHFSEPLLPHLQNEILEPFS